MTKVGAEPEQQGTRTAFVRILIEDIIEASRLHKAEANQTNRRHLIRAHFAAIEGMAWTYREHIVGVARSIDSLTIEEEMAFSEVSYSVTPQGKIVETARFIPLLAMFRLSTKLAERINPELEVRFDDSGWESLRRAIEIRNRITHPKSEADLKVTVPDLTTCRAGFDWLFEIATSAMGLANAAFRNHVETLRSILEELENGDPEAIAAYEAAARSMEDD